MHLLESYSLNAGQKIGEINIFEKFFPLPFDKYVVFQPFTKDSKSYDFWRDVIFIIKPLLKERGIEIVQIGEKGEPVVPDCFPTQGRTQINQIAYIVRNSQLVFGADSFALHLAGHYDKPLVGLYSNNYVNNVRPYFGDKTKQIYLEPNRNGNKPSFALAENPKTINTIAPETVAEGICSLLGIKLEWPYSTVFTGDYYKHSMVEAVPNQIVDAHSLNLDSVIVRMDYEFQQDALFEQLKVSNCSIVTSKPIDLRIIGQFKNKITELVYMIEEDNDPKFVKELQRLGVKFHLVTFLPEEIMKRYKLDFMEFGILHKKEIKKPKCFEVQGKQLWYKSSKFILSNQKIFPSKAAWIEGKGIPNLNPVVSKIDFAPNLEEVFLKELESFTILVDK